MTLFRRTKEIISARYSDWREKRRQASSGLETTIADLEKRIAETRPSVTTAVADTKRLEMRVEALHEQGQSWHTRAKLVLAKGDEGLAKQALQQRLVVKRSHGKLQSEYEQQKQISDELRTAFQQMCSQLDELKRQHNLLVARSRTAEARKVMASEKGSALSSGVNQQLQDMLENVERLEAEADAETSLSTDLDVDAELAEKLRQLEEESQMDTALRELASEIESERDPPESAKGSATTEGKGNGACRAG